MSDLNKFYSPPIDAERVIGTYLYPYVLLSTPDWNDPYSATEIIADVIVRSDQILITRNGGLFVRPPANLSDGLKLGQSSEQDLRAKLEFQEFFAHSASRIICDLALHGIVSEPATPVHISRGTLIDNHALITSAGGGREIYLERTMGPSLQLLQGTWRTHHIHNMDLVNSAIQQEFSSKLAGISDNLPTFIASAYSLFSQYQSSEALLDGWIVIEQIIDWLWRDHVGAIVDVSRKDRLLDSRTYSAAIRIEVLYTAGKLPPEIYQAATIARQHRNQLAHRAKINNRMATECLMAMKDLIEFVCQAKVEPPIGNAGVTW
jgi:hypothetical protein